MSYTYHVGGSYYYYYYYSLGLLGVRMYVIIITHNITLSRVRRIKGIRDEWK